MTEYLHRKDKDIRRLRLEHLHKDMTDSMNLSTEHKALFSLLRAGLWEREADDLSPFPLTDAQWWEVYRMSVRQTVAGKVEYL